MRRCLAALVPVLLLAMLCVGCTRDDAAASDAWRAEHQAWRWPAPLPAFPLVDDRGAAFTLRQLAGPTIVAFAFSRCAVPEACLKTTARLRDLAASEGAPRIVVVTLDPKFDQPRVLAAWKERERLPSAVFATGAPEVVGALGSTINVFAVGQAPDLNHPVKALLLVGGVPTHVWPDNDFTPGDVLGVLRAHANGGASTP